MNYELAKELKDAGFPDSEGWVNGAHEGYSKDIMVTRCAGGVMETPTLEELIEACGDKFGCLTNEGSFWQANHTTEPLEGIGETPTEAVTRLWLALSKK